MELTSEDRAYLKEYIRRKTDTGVPFCPHHPTEKQQELLDSYGTLELFYGGAAGGGKSDGLLMDALRYVDQPGYHALLMRRSYSDLELEDALIPRSHEWLTGHARWRAKPIPKWIFPSGATLSFGYFDKERDKGHYQSAAFSYVGIDQVEQWPVRWAMWMYARLRKVKGKPWPLRFRVTANPGDIGHEWVKARYIDDDTRDKSIKVIRAYLDDNPHLDESYLESLKKLDPVTYEQLRHGSWVALESGDMFSRHWFPIVNEAPHNDTFIRRVRFWDMASTEPKPGKDPDYTCGVKMGVTKDRAYYILDVVHGRWEPEQNEGILDATTKQDGHLVSIREEQEPGSSGKTVIDVHRRGVFLGHDYEGVPSTGSKIIRAKPASAAASKKAIRLVRADWNDRLLNELHMFPFGSHDDIVDAVSGAFNDLEGGMSGMTSITTRKREGRIKRVGWARRSK
jgi:predicted phage terminase large subunit-like protein